MIASSSLFALSLDLGRLLQPSFLGGGLLFYVVAAFSLMKIAERTEHRGEAMVAWIPILNLLLMIKLARRPTWWVLLFLVPGLNFVMWVLLCLALARARGGGFLLGMLMAFVPILGFPILALSSE